MKKLIYLICLCVSTSTLARYYSTDPNHTFPLTRGHIVTRGLQQEAVQSLAYTAPFALPYLWGGWGGNTPNQPWFGPSPLFAPLAFPTFNELSVGSNFSLQPISREEVAQGDLVVFESDQPNHPPQMAIFTGRDRVVTFRIAKSSGHHRHFQYSQLLNDNRIIGVFRLLY